MAWPDGRGVRPGLLTMRQLDPDQLRELVDRLYRAAWAMCRSAPDAEDLVQETFARVLARPRALRGGDQLPYLMRALRNTHLTSLRTASRRPRTAELPPDESSAMGTNVAQPDVAADHRATLDAIAELPEKSRHALVAIDIMGLSYGEAARALGVREATITTRLFRARQGVARALTDEPDGREEATGNGRGWARVELMAARRKDSSAAESLRVEPAPP